MEFLLSADNVAANESMFSTNEGGEAWDSDGTLGTGWSDSGRESAPSGSSSASSVGDVPATTLVCTATCEQLPSSPATAPPASPRLLAILEGWHLQAVPGFGSVLTAAGMPEDSYGSVTEKVRMRAIASLRNHPQLHHRQRPGILFRLGGGGLHSWLHSYFARIPVAPRLHACR